MRASVVVGAALILAAVAAASAQGFGENAGVRPAAGEAVDVVPFGSVLRGGADGKDYGVMWEDPRDIFRVVVRFREPAAAPEPARLRIEYWQSGWPHRRIPRDRPSGAGSSGWLDIGDWFQGKWVAADTRVAKDGGVTTFTFAPVNAKEFPDVGDFDATWRTTLKLRVIGETQLPAIASFEAYTDYTWQPLAFEVEWGGAAEELQTWDGRLEAFNGVIESVEPLSKESGVAVSADGSWLSRVEGGTDGVRVKGLYAATKGMNSFDETIFTVRTACETASFAASDLIAAGWILIPDYGLLIRRAGETVPYAAALDTLRRAKNIYRRVFDEPEQTLTRAWDAVPAKSPHYIPLSFEGGRQHFGVDEKGEVFCMKNWISRLPGNDTLRCLWKGDEIRYRFGLPASKPAERGLEGGDLPIITSAWDAGGVRYRQTAFVVPLAGVPAPGVRIRADDALVLMIRIAMSPVGRGGQARLVLSAADGSGTETLALEDDRIMAGSGRLRMVAKTAGPKSLAAKDGAVVFTSRLGPGDGERSLTVAIPFITLADPREWDEVRAIDYDRAHKAVANYWKGRIAVGTRITTPEPMINDFYNAHVSHLLINTEREVGDGDRYMAKVGTFRYGVFANESCMMVSDLDRRGFHERAEQALESWVHYQGSVGLPGDFSSREGEFYGVAGYEEGGYNQHHGWVLWNLGEHYLVTRDGKWLERVAPAIVRGCEWIIRERRRTIEEARRTPVRAIERGLLPPGRLEDIGDWRSWLSTNVYTWWGMRNAAAALAAAGNAEGARLEAEAEAYRRDIIAAYAEAMRRSPVVRLRDGTWIPHVPSDVHRRGRSFGWITETLEGAIHLVRTGLIEPESRLATWIIEDYEDNLYLSEQYGYDLKGEAFEKNWFHLGGISMQANLLHNPIPYLLRDEPKHFLRAYFNAFAVSYFPDTRMMTEHALPNIGDWRGDHYKASDEANSTCYLRLMFVEERGDDLWLGAALPRYWLADGNTVGIERSATYFGPVSMRITSRAAEGRITMRIEPPVRNPPKRIYARLRHPDGKRMVRCEVDGKPYDRFDPDKEWVVFEGLTKPLEIRAHY